MTEVHFFLIGPNLFNLTAVAIQVGKHLRIRCLLAFDHRINYPLELTGELYKEGWNGSIAATEFVVQFDEEHNELQSRIESFSMHPLFCKRAICTDFTKSMRIIIRYPNPVHCGEYSCIVRETNGIFVQKRSIIIGPPYAFCISSSHFHHFCFHSL